MKLTTIIATLAALVLSVKAISVANHHHLAQTKADCEPSGAVVVPE